MVAVAALSLAAVACQSSPKSEKVVEMSDDGKGATIQLSRDGRSMLAVDLAAAAKTAREELRSRKELSLALMNSIAELSLLAGDPQMAAREARSLLKRDLKNTDAMKTLIKVAIIQNKPEEAVLLADNAMAVQSRDADILCLKGLASFMTGDPLAARQSWKKALEVNPTHVTAQMNLAALYFHNRNVQHAGAAFEKVLALQPRNPDALVGKSLVLAAQGQAEAARTQLAEVLTRNPKSALVLYNLAILEKERFQNFTAAMEYTERYLAIAKGDRRSTERFIAQREELKMLIAKKQGPMSDKQLREMAATRGQSATPPGQEESPQEAGQGQMVSRADEGQEAQPKPATKGAVDVNTDDASALEEAIK
jgi:tetratricopeptide (TPR) repeat protein